MRAGLIQPGVRQEYSTTTVDFSKFMKSDESNGPKFRLFKSLRFNYNKFVYKLDQLLIIIYSHNYNSTYFDEFPKVLRDLFCHIEDARSATFCDPKSSSGGSRPATETREATREAIGGGPEGHRGQVDAHRLQAYLQEVDPAVRIAVLSILKYTREDGVAIREGHLDGLRVWDASTRRFRAACQTPTASEYMTRPDGEKIGVGVTFQNVLFYVIIITGHLIYVHILWIQILFVSLMSLCGVFFMRPP